MSKNFNPIELDLKRAEFAYYKVKKVDSEYQKEYRSRARDFPSLVQEDLLRAFVFYSAKKGVYVKYLEDVISWFDEFPDKKLRIDNVHLKSCENFIKYIFSLKYEDYIFLKNEILKLSIWFKRFAEALIEISKKGEN